MSNRRHRAANKAVNQEPRPSIALTSIPSSVLLRHGTKQVYVSGGGHVSVMALSMGEAEQGYEAWSGETFRGLLRQVQVEAVGLDRINRIQNGLFENNDMFWNLENTPAGARVSRNVTEEWTLAGHGTGFIQAEQPGAVASAVYSDPFAGEQLQALEGEDYLFGGYFGLHRATGEIMLEFLDGNGAQIAKSVTPLQAAKIGGRRIEDYGAAVAPGRAPVDTVALRLRVTLKQEAHSASDSFLFMTSLFLVRGKKEGVPVTCPDPAFAASLFVAENPKPVLLRLILPRAEFALDDDDVLRIVERASGATLPPGEISIRPLRQTVLHNLRLEGTVLAGELEGNDAHDSAETLVLLVDGMPDPRVEMPDMSGRRSFRLPLPVHLLDGRGHVLQIRTQSGHLLGSTSGVVPAQLTPWDALQRYAGMPLPLAESPAAADRYRSLAASLQAAAQGNGEERARQLSDAHAIVVEGFEQRRSRYAQLVFPAVGKPTVSVVIPVHNKFDVTYHCLASLILACNQALFEIIVVDDASSDETTRLREIVLGVEVVRNDTVLGFVRSCNRGAESARGHYTVMLNNDTEPTAGWLDELIFAFENFEGWVSPAPS